MRHPKIAIIGARGFGRYGGFETFVGELVPRLEGRGYEIYCSSERNEAGDNPPTMFGSTVVYFPMRFPHNYTLRKMFENLYDWYFVSKCTLSPRCDLIYCLGTLSGISLIIPKIFGATSIVNVDGLEWKRAKLSALERALLKFYFIISCWLSTIIVVDNRQLFPYIPRRLRKKAVFLPYGVSCIAPPKWERELISEYAKDSDSNINPNDYWLVVARLEPENNIHTIIEGYLSSQSTKPLVIVGDFTSLKFKTALDKMLTRVPKEKKVLMVGSIYNKRVLDMLRFYCIAYLHGHSVGGTNPSLLEAMGAGNLVIAHDNPFNREVGGDAALFFRESTDLASLLRGIERDMKESSGLKRAAQNRAFEDYEWEKVADSYNNMFLKVLDEEPYPQRSRQPR
jgi:rhamnosyltransferase